jgi:hypothetical protein
VEEDRCALLLVCNAVSAEGTPSDGYEPWRHHGLEAFRTPPGSSRDGRERAIDALGKKAPGGKMPVVL